MYVYIYIFIYLFIFFFYIYIYNNLRYPALAHARHAVWGGGKPERKDSNTQSLRIFAIAVLGVPTSVFVLITRQTQRGWQHTA